MQLKLVSIDVLADGRKNRNIRLWKESRQKIPKFLAKAVCNVLRIKLENKSEAS